MIPDEVSFERQAYEIDDLWKPESVSKADTDRIEILYRCIPQDVRSVLDVGCGGGIFVNYLMSHADRFERLCGVDRSESALKYVKAEKRLASIDRLPFDANSFDMVASLEVIEHLPVNVYDLSLREICRVAKRYVLVSVPNKESLESALVVCPVCHTRYNPDYHMRSFKRNSMQTLLTASGFECLQVFYIHEEPRYLAISLIRAGARLAGKKRVPWYAICPMCGYKDDSGPLKNRNQAFWTSALESAVKKIWPRKLDYRWIAGLYVKQ